MSDMHLTVNDILPVLRATLKDGNGNPVDLTGAEVRFIMRSVDGGVPKVASPGFIEDELGGIAVYVWAAGDTDTEGSYYGDFEVTFSGDRKETFPDDRSITIGIHPDREATTAARALSPLITPERFAESRGDVYDPGDLQTLRAIQDASAIFRALAHQTISLVEDDVVELEGNWTSRLWLPERPVISVKDVSVRFGWVQEPTLIADSAVFTTRRGLLTTWDGCAWGGPDATVRLTYSHGYAQIPEDVEAVVTAMVARDMRGQTRTEGLVSETIGQHAVQYGATGVVATAAGGLTEVERSVIHRYRPVYR